MTRYSQSTIEVRGLRRARSAPIEALLDGRGVELRCALHQSRKRCTKQRLHGRLEPLELAGKRGTCLLWSAQKLPRGAREAHAETLVGSHLVPDGMAVEQFARALGERANASAKGRPLTARPVGDGAAPLEQPSVAPPPDEKSKERGCDDDAREDDRVVHHGGEWWRRLCTQHVTRVVWCWRLCRRRGKFDERQNQDESRPGGDERSTRKDDGRAMERLLLLFLW